MYDFIEEIKEFWLCSLKNDFSTFDFKRFFIEFENRLWRKLATHGYFSVDDYIESNSLEMYELKNDIGHWMYMDNNWVSMNKESVVILILENLMAEYRKQLPAEFDDLMELYGHFLEEKPSQLVLSNDRKKMIGFVDRCIHAQHASGFIIHEFDYIDMDDLREEVEYDWKEQVMEEWNNRRISIREIRYSPAYI